MELKPVNKIDSDANTIRVSDGNSPIRLIFKDAKGGVINLYDKIDYFYLTKDNEKFYSVTDISYDGDEVIIRLPKLRKGKYKAEIRDKDGSIYPANEDLYILLRRSFEDDKDIYYFGHREDILNSVEPMIIQHIEKNPEQFRGERGKQGFPGRDGLPGINGKDGKDGKDGEDGKDGDKGDKGEPGKDAVIPDDILNIVQKFDEEYLIPSDYITIQKAIEELSTRNIKQGKKINLLIESGHQLDSQIILKDGNYNQFYINSVDEIVYLKDDFKKINFSEFINCHAPNINVLIDGKGLNVNGIKLDKLSRILILPGKGFINSGSTNLYCNGASYAFAESGIFTGGSRDSDDESSGTGGSGITAWGSTVFAENADVSNSKVYGVQAAHGGLVLFRGGNASNCIRHGIRATNSGKVEARSAKADNCGVYGVYSLSSSIVNAYNVSCLNCGVAGIYASQSSTINARESNVSGSHTGVLLDRGSNGNFYNGIANNCIINGVKVTGGSMLNGFGVSIENTGDNVSHHGIICDFGSNISFQGSRIINSGGKDVYINNGSTVNLKSSKTTNSTENKPITTDTNVTALNVLNSFGIIWG